MGPSAILTNAQGPRVDLQQSHGLNCKMVRNKNCRIYFPMGNTVDRVHGTLHRWHAWVHGGPRGVQTLGMLVPHQRTARKCDEARELAGVGQGGRGRRGRVRGGLTRA
jgi:hypothetical protein